MNRLGVRQKNWLVFAHVLFSGIWFGTALCMVIIALANSRAVNGEQLYFVNAVLKLLDDVVIVPTANLSLFTGGLLCWLTIWGFFKHYWVIVKWIATVTLIVTGTVWLGPWVNAMTSISQTDRLTAMRDPLYLFDRQAVLIGGVIQMLCLFAIVAISILKPWGRRVSHKAT